MTATDKACNPATFLELTKLDAEMQVRHAHEATDCSYFTVRIDNVLSSCGSVVPFFQQQIVAVCPVTATHPRLSSLLHDHP
jgi:FlaA1/EpsC-like NDP-sugar epimerase